jgi:Uma2 family endonuclease
MNPTTPAAEPQTPPSELERKIEALAERYRASRCEDVEALLELTDLLPDSDGEPLESPWHFAAIALLKEVLLWHWRDRDDFYVGGNMFVYYDLDRLGKPLFRGPDFFYVSSVDRYKHRDKWVLWSEGGKYPDLVIEFLSPSTAKLDRTVKKDLYQNSWKVTEYFCYEPDLGQLEGWKLVGGRYEALAPDERGWMWSEQLGMWLGKWSGEFQDVETAWLRPYDRDGQLILFVGEAERQRAEQAERRAEQAERRAEQERAKAEAIEEEFNRLKARVAELEGRGPSDPA